MVEGEAEWERQRLRGLRLVVRALRLMGAWPPGAAGGGGGGGGRGRLYVAYVAAATAFMASYPACALCVLAGARADIQVTAVLVGVTSSYVGAIFKMFTLCFKRSQVSRLVLTVKREFPRSPLLAGEAQRAVAAAAGAHGARLTACFVSLCCFSVFNWSLGPLALHALGWGGGSLALCLPWLPSHQPQPGGAAFQLVYGYQVLTLVLVALWVGALDAFLLVLLVYAAGHLRVLNCTLLQMGARSDDDPDGQTQVKSATNANAMLRECAKHHLEVCRFVQSVEEVAAPALTLQLLVSTFLLCMSAFTATQIPVGSPLLARVVVYMLTGASELLIFCKYCDDVISESERVQQALYGSGWASRRRPFCRGVLIMLARAQRPLCLRAAHVHPVSLQTFTKVLNASYTVFTLMRQIKD